jgi:DNA-binding transcriptional ArsR family regulator
MKSFSNEAYYMIFSALANRTRLAIIDVLSEGSKTLFEVSLALDQQESVIIKDLERLEHSALMCSQGLGEERRYSLNKEFIEPISEILEFHTSKYCPQLKVCIPPDRVRQFIKTEAAKEMFIEHE